MDIKSGVININKPEGWTSQDVCAKLRGRLGIKRVGHTGTLDPLATGVLPIAVGYATRMIEYYDADVKIYRAIMQLGTTTDTLDCTGNVTSKCDFSGIKSEMIEGAFSRMQGVVLQTPPKYSAIKVDGKRLYEYAREGKDVDIKPRHIYILGISDIDTDIKSGRVSFTVACSKGTYVRSICDDIGRDLGCGAHMTGLTRLKSGYFAIEDALNIEDLVSMSDEEVNNLIVPVDETLGCLGRAIINGDEEGFLHGMKISPDEVYVTEDPDAPIWSKDRERLLTIYRMYDANGVFLGTARADEITGVFKPDKVIIHADSK